MFKVVFRPDEEEIGTYLSRVTRLVMALKTLGHELPSTDVDKLILKAEITQAVYEEIGTRDEKGMVRSLRNQFTALALDVVVRCGEECASQGHR